MNNIQTGRVTCHTDDIKHRGILVDIALRSQSVQAINGRVNIGNETKIGHYEKDEGTCPNLSDRERPES
jgi:hypothetical protein